MEENKLEGKKQIKKILWSLIIMSFASTIGYLLLTVAFSLIHGIITGNITYIDTPKMYDLSLGIYRIVEAIVFCLIFRKATFKEFKEEKFDFVKLIPFLIIIIYFSSTCSVGSKVVSDITATRIFRAVLVAPIFEELMFRGAIQRTLKSYGGEKFAIIFATLLFAMFHMDSGQFFFTIPLGLLAGYAASRYSLKGAILIHMVCNFMHVLYSLNPILTENIMTITMLGAFAVLIWKAKKIFAFFKQKTEKGTYRSIIFTLPMIIFTFIWLLCVIGTI